MLENIRNIFGFQLLMILIAVFGGIYNQEIKLFLMSRGQSWTKTFNGINSKNVEGSEQLFTKEELAKFNGHNDAPVYLALLGTVYDVSKGIKHYGPGCAYNYFVGRDCSVSFVTGEFEKYNEETADDVLSLKPSDLLNLANWKLFYDKDYIYKGRLIGRYYDANGSPTPYNYKYLALVEEARQAKLVNIEMRRKYPDCNISWSVKAGSHVWCTTSSGTEERSWVGYPRKLYEDIDSDKFRCVCVPDPEMKEEKMMIKPYDNCPPLSHECFYNADG